MGSSPIDFLFTVSFAILGLGTELSAVTVAALTALLTTLFAAPIRLFVDQRLQRSRVEIEYEHEQRKALRAKIASHHGRLLEAALDLNYRLINLTSNWEEGWHDVGRAYRAPIGSQHYLRSTAFRFVRLAGLGDRFEREAIVVDARIADPTDQAFVRYPKAFRWAMTSVALFGTLEYDHSRTGDHFFTEQLRQFCAKAWGSAEDLNFDSFETLVAGDDVLDELLEFFDAARPGELRWDRLMSLQLLLTAFINTFGYDFQRSDQAWLEGVVSQINHREIIDALRTWLTKLGLGQDRGSKELLMALERRAER